MNTEETFIHLYPEYNYILKRIDEEYYVAPSVKSSLRISNDIPFSRKFFEDNFVEIHDFTDCFSNIVKEFNLMKIIVFLEIKPIMKEKAIISYNYNLKAVDRGSNTLAKLGCISNLDCDLDGEKNLVSFVREYWKGLREYWKGLKEKYDV